MLQKKCPDPFANGFPGIELTHVIGKTFSNMLCLLEKTLHKEPIKILWIKLNHKFS